jgi:hypothetical protein
MAPQSNQDADGTARPGVFNEGRWLDLDVARPAPRLPWQLVRGTRGDSLVFFHQQMDLAVP